MNHVVFYANCQYAGFQYFLKKIWPKATYQNFYNFNMIDLKEKIPIKEFGRANLFIYQPIKKEHEKYSTHPDVENNILTHLGNGCIKVSFPYIYNSGAKKIAGKIDKVVGEWDGTKTFDECIDIMEEREKKTDISFSDFIREHHENHTLFLTQNHPTTPIYVHGANQLMEILGRPERWDPFADYPHKEVCDFQY